MLLPGWARIGGLKVWWKFRVTKLGFVGFDGGRRVEEGCCQWYIVASAKATRQRD